MQQFVTRDSNIKPKDISNYLGMSFFCAFVDGFRCNKNIWNNEVEVLSMNNTALGAKKQEIVFISKAHEKFYY